MRQVGLLPGHDEAKRFVDYLLTEGIATRAEKIDDGRWLIWVIQEDHYDRSKSEYERFKASPDDPRFAGREPAAEKLRAERRIRALQAQKNLNVVRTGPKEKLSDRVKRIPLTFAIIAICGVVGLWTTLGENRTNTDPLMFVSRQHENDEGWNPKDPNDATIDIRAGQVWRLLTPAIVHLGVFHLIFNMMWMHMLGGQIETRKGKLKYLGLVLVLAVFSNLVQVYISRHPFFGGMSGVVYGLFGYIWMKSRFDPRDRFHISQTNVNLMMIWFFICFAPGMNVANGGHAGGLVLGVILGFLSAKSD